MVPVSGLLQQPIFYYGPHTLLPPLPAPPLSSLPLHCGPGEIMTGSQSQRLSLDQLPHAISSSLMSPTSRQTGRHTWERKSMEPRGEGGRKRRREARGERQREKKKNSAQCSQASGPESLPLLRNQKHLLIASKRQRGSVSLSAAVIPHSDEHLKCQDPFQQLCTAIRPSHRSP